MKPTIQILVLAVLMGISAGLSAQTALKFPTVTGEAVIQKTAITQTEIPNFSETLCRSETEGVSIGSALQLMLARQVQVQLRAKLASYNSCVSDCVNSLLPLINPNEDPNDPKDGFSASGAVSFCQEVCSQ